MASCATGTGLAGGHRQHLGLGPGVQRHQPEGGGAHGQRRERGQAQHRQHHPAHEHVDALRQRATHPRRQPPPAAHAPQQQHEGGDAHQAHGQRNARCTPAPGVAQQQRAVQVLHPARQRRGLPGVQHPAIGRIHVGRLRLVAVKAEHHDGTRGQVADFLRARGRCAVTRSTSVATDRSPGAAGACHACCTGSNARMAPVMPSTTARVPSSGPASGGWLSSPCAPFTGVGRSATGCTACRPAACRRWRWTAARGPPTGCRACLLRRHRCGFRSPRRSVHRPESAVTLSVRPAPTLAPVTPRGAWRHRPTGGSSRTGVCSTWPCRRPPTSVRT
jgi:hypothetical protein